MAPVYSQMPSQIIGFTKLVSPYPSRLNSQTAPLFVLTKMASHLQARPSPALAAVIQSGFHMLRVETDRWVLHKPLRDQRICYYLRHATCERQTTFLLFGWPLYKSSRDQQDSLFGPDQSSLHLFGAQCGPDDVSCSPCLAVLSSQSQKV